MAGKASKIVKILLIAFLTLWLLHLISVNFNNTLESRRNNYFSSLFEDAKFKIRYSDIDSTLQEQSIYLPEILTGAKANTTVLKLWRSVCDERDEGLPKSVITYILSKDKNFPIRKQINRISYRISCRAYDQSANELHNFFESSVIHTHYLNEGVIVICPFSRKLSCPKYSSLQIASNEPTHLMPVEMQDLLPLNSSSKNQSRIIICAPVITNRISTVLPTRLVEYFEYNKLIGVNQVYMPMLNSSVYPIEGYDESVEKLLQYYEKQNYLVRFQAAAFIPKKATDMFAHVRYVKPMHLSYCLVKVALKTDYVIVQDFDEVIGFNTNKFNTLSDAISYVRKVKGMSYQNFMLRDTLMDHHCKPNVHQLNYSSFVISEAKYHYNNTHLNMGKSIHHSSTCIAAFPHYCILYRTSEVLSHTPGSRYHIGKENEIQDKRKKLSLTSNGTILRSFHFRMPENHHGRKSVFARNESQSKWCNASNIIETDWLDSLKTTLKQNSINVLAELNL